MTLHSISFRHTYCFEDALSLSPGERSVSTPVFLTPPPTCPSLPFLWKLLLGATPIDSEKVSETAGSPKLSPPC